MIFHQIQQIFGIVHMHESETKPLPQPKILLSDLLKKLFNAEDLCLHAHINFIADLLVYHDCSDYLKGLVLSEIEFDISTSSPPRIPATLQASRKSKIGDSPITYYINSIASIYHAHTELLTWNVLVLKAALYLLALPQIKPDLFEKQHTEHLNTIKRLFQRFRVANKSFFAKKKDAHALDYQAFLTLKFPALFLSLEQFVESALQPEADQELNDFQKNFCDELRIAFNYVLKSRPKIAKSSVDSKLQYRTWDTDGTINEIIETKKSNRGLANEQALDEQEDPAVIVQADQITPLARHSKNAQRMALSLIPKHMQRQDHLLTASCLLPSVYTISDLITYLYHDDKKHNDKSVLVVLLCLITGVGFKDWLNFQKRRVKRLNHRQVIKLQSDQYYLSTKFSIFEDATFEYPESLINNTVHLDIPIPNHFIDRIKAEPIITEDELKKKIRIIKDEVKIPQLNLSKTSSLLHHVILQKTGNRQLADIITGVDASHSSSSSYCHYNVNKLQKNYVKVLSELCTQLAENDYGDIVYSDQSICFGSQKAPSKNVIKDILFYLYTKIYTTSDNDWVESFNAYSIWMWHILLLFTAARPVRDFPGFLNNISFQQQTIMLSDKEGGGRRGFGRLIPLCAFLIGELKKYLRFLEHIQQHYMAINREISAQIDAIFNNEQPLLNLLQNGTLTPLTPSNVRDFHPEVGLAHPNWHRHTTRAFLTNKQIPEPLILALFGHEAFQQEAAHPFSSLSLNQYRALATHLNEMQEYFEIIGVNLNVLIA